jgi:hypothetical protein
MFPLFMSTACMIEISLFLTNENRWGKVICRESSSSFQLSLHTLTV